MESLWSRRFRFNVLVATRIHRRLTQIVCCLIIVFATTHNAQVDSLEIDRFSPSGIDVPATIGELSIEFNKNIMPLGRSNQSYQGDAIVIEPHLDCSWVWTNSNVLTCFLNESLIESSVYALRIEPRFTALDGSKLAKTYSYEIRTALPKIAESVYSWSGPALPSLSVTFSQPVTATSIDGKVYLRNLTTQKSERIESRNVHPADDTDGMFFLDENGDWIDVFEVLRLVDGEISEFDQSRLAAKHWIVNVDSEIELGSSYAFEFQQGLRSPHGEIGTDEIHRTPEFTAFEDFRLVGLECHNEAGEVHGFVISQEHPAPPDEFSCQPEDNVGLLFTVPVSDDARAGGLMMSPPPPNPHSGFSRRNADVSTYRMPFRVVNQNVHSFFRSDFHYPLAPNTQYRITDPSRTFDAVSATVQPDRFQDIFGRRLSVPTELRFKTTHLKPQLLMHETNILLSGGSTDASARTINLGNIELDLNIRDDPLTANPTRFQGATSVGGKTDWVQLHPLNLRSKLHHQTGQVLGKLTPTSAPGMGTPPSTTCFELQIAPYWVMVSLGRLRSIVWVTDIHTGELVSDAHVAVVNSKALHFESLYETRTDEHGTALLPTKEELWPRGSDTPNLSAARGSHWNEMAAAQKTCFDLYQSHGAVIVSGPSGSSMVSLVNRSNYYQPRYGHFRDSVESRITAWGHTAQGIYRPGDTVKFKIYVRDWDLQGLSIPKPRAYRLLVLDREHQVVHSKTDVPLNEFGAFHGEFKLPDGIRRGQIEFRVKIESESGPLDGATSEEQIGTAIESQYDRISRNSITAMQVDVVDFVVEPFQVQANLNSDSYEVGNTLKLSSTATLHAGGPYVNAPVSIHGQLSDSTFETSNPRTRNYTFWSPEDDSTTIWTEEDFDMASHVTDQNGSIRASMELNNNEIYYGWVSTVVAIRDDRGKSVVDDDWARYRSTDRFVGIRITTQDIELGKPISSDAVVVDHEGTPTNDLPIQVVIQQQVDDNRSLGKPKYQDLHTCEFAIESESRQCDFTPRAYGSYLVSASIEVEQQRVQIARQGVHVARPIPVEYREIKDLEISVSRPPEYQSSESTTFQVGEVLDLSVETHYPDSHALFTVERIGVIDHWVERLDEPNQTIKFPVQSSYAPGADITVTMMSVNSRTRPHNLWIERDMRKFPNARVASLALQFAEASKELDVDIQTERTTFEPGDTVNVRVLGRFRQPSNPIPIEFAVVVIDEGVLDLISRETESFDPYRGLRFLDEYDRPDMERHMLLGHSTTLDIELAGAPGYARASTTLDELRNNTELISYWNPALRTNSEGNAEFSFRVGDRLTGWRIIAVGVTASDIFGMGESTITTNRPLELRSAMPNQVTESDTFNATFSVLNRQDEEIPVDLNIHVSGDAQNAAHIRSVTALPYERVLVSVPVQAESIGAGTEKGMIQFEVVAEAPGYKDGLFHELPVYPNRAVHYATYYGSTTATTIGQPVEIPSDVRIDSGNLSLNVSPTILSSAIGPIKYAQQYPYECWEQRLSKAVIAAQHDRLNTIVGLDWPDDEEYVTRVLVDAARYQSSTGGMGYWRGDDSRTSIYLSVYTAMAFNWLSAAGFEVPDGVSTHLRAYLRSVLENNGFPQSLHERPTQIPTIRALIFHVLNDGSLDDLAKFIEIASDLEVIDPFGLVHLLEFSRKLPIEKSIQKRVLEQLTNRIARSGDSSLIQHVPQTRFNYFLSSPIKTTCSAISAFVRAHEDGNPLVSHDLIASLARGVVFSKSANNRWSNTHDSVFCLNALIDYVRVMERGSNDIHPSVKLALEDQSKIVKLKQNIENAPYRNVHSFSTPLVPEVLGKSGNLLLDNASSSRIYFETSIDYEPKEPDGNQLNRGIDIRREYWIKQDGVWQTADESTELKRGQIIHVDIYLNIRDDRSFVVVDDPVPGALEPINSQLAIAATHETRREKALQKAVSEEIGKSRFKSIGYGRLGFYQNDLNLDSVRFYSDFVGPGNYLLTWVGQVIATGDFQARQTHAEAMYTPEVYGKSKALKLRVGD